MVISGGTMSCPLCDALENEAFLYEDSEIVILPTLPYGNHKKRIMVVSKEHITQVGEKRKKKYMKIFLDFCKGYFNDESVFYYGDARGYSVKCHWHCVAFDWDENNPHLDRPYYVMETGV